MAAGAAGVEMTARLLKAVLHFIGGADCLGAQFLTRLTLCT